MILFAFYFALLRYSERELLFLSESPFGNAPLPMLTFLVSWETCTSIFRLSLLALFLRFPARIASNSDCGRKPSLMGVTVAEGTEEVGVLDLLPVLLGVAATESDSDPSSWGVGDDDMGAGDKQCYELYVVKAVTPTA